MLNRSSEVLLSKRQRVSGGAIPRRAGSAARNTTTKDSVSQAAESLSKVPSCFWDAATLEAELEHNAESTLRAVDSHRPGKMSQHQLCKAAEEFVKRCSNEEDIPYFLVSRNCKDMPSRDFELAALQQSIKKVSKLCGMP